MRKRATSRRATRGKSKRGRRRTRNVRSKYVGGKEGKSPPPPNKSNQTNTTYITYNDFGSWFSPYNLTHDKLDTLANLYNDEKSYSEFTNAIINNFNIQTSETINTNANTVKLTNITKLFDGDYFGYTKKYPRIQLIDNVNQSII